MLSLCLSFRLEYEARNKKKEAKELSIIEGLEEQIRKKEAEQMVE